jgi:hypothetical protein
VPARVSESNPPALLRALPLLADWSGSARERARGELLRIVWGGRVVALIRTKSSQSAVAVLLTLGDHHVWQGVAIAHLAGGYAVTELPACA